MKSKKFNLHSALTHKSQAVHLLEAQIRNYHNLGDQYSQLLDQKHSLQCKIQNQKQTNEKVLKYHQDILFSQDQRVGQMQKDLSDLERQLLLKNEKLKEENTLEQELQSYYDECGAQIREKVLFSDETKNMKELIQAQKLRICEQQSCFEEQISKSKHIQTNIKASIDKIKEKERNIKNYIRELLKQQKKIQDQLVILEEQNNSIDSVNTQLHYDCEETRGVVKKIKDQIEERKILVKTEELRAGRIRKQIDQKMKLKRMELENFNDLKHRVEEKQRECQKLTELQREAVQMMEKEHCANIQIERINVQLQQDLAVCQKHLENVSKNNAVIKNSLMNYHKTNKVVIKKLEQVGDEKNFSSKDYLDATNDGFSLLA